MWERFSFYGMRAMLVLFLTSVTGEFHWTKQRAGLLYATYTGLVYATGLFGGWVADRFLGTHRALIVGSILIASGHFCLAVPGRTIFFVGLALIVSGRGNLKSALPFGTFLALGAAFAAVLGPGLLDWYLGQFK